MLSWQRVMTVCSSSVTLKRIHAVSLALAVFFCTRYRKPSNTVKAHVQNIGATLSSDQRQVYGVAQPGWCHLPDADQFDKITRRINGGQNGAVDRQALYAWALKVLA